MLPMNYTFSLRLCDSVLADEARQRRLSRADGVVSGYSPVEARQLEHGYLSKLWPLFLGP